MKKAWKFLKQLYNSWSEDRVSTQAAALAYYTLFSLAPILLICISIIAVVFGEEAARGQILAEIGSMIGKEPALQIQEIIQNANKPGTALFTRIISIIILVLTASGVFNEIQAGLNAIWGVKANPNLSWYTKLKYRFVPFVLVIGIAFLLLVSLVISAALSFLTSYIPYLLGTDAVLGIIISHIVSIFIITLLFVMIFKVLPDVALRWHDVWQGALITSLLFNLGKFLIGFYLNHFQISSVYGAAGSMIVILVWVFYSSQIFFIGAEITKVISTNKGKKIVPTKNAILVNKVGAKG